MRLGRRLISTVEVRAMVNHSHVAEGNWRRHEAGWGATGGEMVVRRRTNPIRRHVSDELAHSWRSLKLTDPVAVVDKTRVRRITWLGTEHQEG